MLKFMKVSRNQVEHSGKLFEGERSLVTTGIIGFILSAGIAIYILFKGSIISPEGNMWDAFSFNAAIGIYVLSIAAILPLTRLGTRKRKAVRWFFIIGNLHLYHETVQNFRGISPRFTREKGNPAVDIIAGMIFGQFR